MSTTIGKGATSASDSDAAVRPADSERRGAAQDAATRSAKFRTALGETGDGATGGGRLGPDGKPRPPGRTSTGDRSVTSDKPPASTGGASRPEHSGREVSEGKPEKPTRPLGLTEEQALILAGATGTDAGAVTVKGGKKQGQGHLAAADDLGVGSPGSGAPATTAVKETKAKSVGDEVIAEVAAAVSAAAQVGMPSGWSRPEGPTRPERPSRELPQPLPGVDPIHQLLIGKGPNGAEARMRISVGPLAGTEILLREGPGGIQAAILTQNASSRQTLSTAMDAVAQRLKEKGHKLEVRIDGRSSAGREVNDHGQGRGK